jgi:hypothetical protein
VIKDTLCTLVSHCTLLLLFAYYRGCMPSSVIPHAPPERYLSERGSLKQASSRGLVTSAGRRSGSGAEYLSHRTITPTEWIAEREGEHAALREWSELPAVQVLSDGHAGPYAVPARAWEIATKSCHHLMVCKLPRPVVADAALAATGAVHSTFRTAPCSLLSLRDAEHK